jgi:predicted TIM-barrel fold metal-dependent hydrolase
VFDVFDCHHHVGPAPDSSLAGNSAHSGFDKDQERAARVAIMDRAGVRQAAVIIGHAYQRSNGLVDTRQVNDDIAAYRDDDRFPVAIGVVEPLYGADGLSEIARCADELQLAGLSFHARFQGCSMDNPWVARFVDRMGEHGLVPILHSVGESNEESLWKVGALARAFPDLPMLVLDAFAGFDSSKEASFIAELCPNLLFDTSLAHSADYVVPFARRFGAERLVFGTDLYSPPIGERISHVLPQILESTLGDAEKQAIVGDNARRLFGLSGQ